MTGKSVLKRVFGAFLLMILVCIPQSADASNTATLRSDTISLSKSLGNLNLNQILQSANNLVNEISDIIADDVDPTDLNLKLDFDFDIKSSHPFLLIQVIYNTLAADDGLISQFEDKEIEKFDQKSLNKLKRQFIKRSNKEIRELCKGDLLDGIQIKE